MHIVHNEWQRAFTVSVQIWEEETTSHIIAFALICEFSATATTTVIKESFQLVPQLKAIYAQGRSGFYVSGNNFVAYHKDTAGEHLNHSRQILIKM